MIEDKCEKLGAAHLLMHGIFGFKATAPGAVTDLILGAPIDPESPELRNARTVALTEWKVVRRASEAQDRVEDARRQASQYADGLLAGLALNSRRYLVLVSKQDLDPTPTLDSQDGLYQLISIAIEPRTPSKSGS
jgi:hypothetical protein